MTDLIGLSGPATALINRVSEFVGGALHPRQIRRIAKAEAEAEVIRAWGKLAAGSLHERTVRRFAEEQIASQSNIESIVLQALPVLDDETASPDDVKRDWFANFFEKCRIYSEPEMQTVWSRILAGEANNPGSFSRKTVNLVADLDTLDAALFVNLCCFIWESDSDRFPLIFETTDDIYTKSGINFISIGELETLGLIRVNTLTGFIRRETGRMNLSYFEQRVVLEPELGEDGYRNLSIGNTLLTKSGVELSKICGTSPVDGYYEHVCNKWRGESIFIAG